METLATNELAKYLKTTKALSNPPKFIIIQIHSLYLNNRGKKQLIKNHLLLKHTSK